MATNFSAIAQSILSWDYTDTDGADREYTDRNAIGINPLHAQLTNGTGDQQANIVIHERRTLTNGQSYSYDLAGGVVDFRGQLKTFARIKAILVVLLSTANDVQLEVGGGSNAFASWLGASGDTVRVGPKGLLFKWEPSAGAFAVTAGTGDILKITATGTCEYDIAIIGADA